MRCRGPAWPCEMRAPADREPAKDLRSAAIGDPRSTSLPAQPQPGPSEAAREADEVIGSVLVLS
jgi:hypothetical protein